MQSFSLGIIVLYLDSDWIRVLGDLKKNFPCNEQFWNTVVFLSLLLSMLPTTSLLYTVHLHYKKPNDDWIEKTEVLSEKQLKLSSGKEGFLTTSKHQYNQMNFLSFRFETFELLAEADCIAKFKKISFCWLAGNEKLFVRYTSLVGSFTLWSRSLKTRVQVPLLLHFSKIFSRSILFSTYEFTLLL